MGQAIRRADMDPPALFANSHPSFILMDHVRLDQSGFELGFYLSQLLMTGGDKGGNAACRELDSQQLLQQLARTSVGYSLAFHQIGRQGLDTCPILDRSRNGCREGRSCQVGAGWTLFFFRAMFGDPKPLGRQIDHLASLRDTCRLGTQIVVTLLTADDRVDEDLIGRLHLSQVMPTMAHLAAWFLATLLPQALGYTHEAVGGGGQTAIMTIFGLVPFEGVDALLQSVDQPFEDFHALVLRANGDDGLFEPFAQVLIRLVRLFQLCVFVLQRFAQCPILGSELVEFFILRHAATLADCPSSCNCIALLNSYHFRSDPSPTSIHARIVATTFLNL